MKRFYLEILVFVCGAVVMAYEIIGSRMLGPYVGTSYFVWTAVIGIILLSLSAGYYYGGWLADKKPRADILAMLILIAGGFILLTSYTKDILLTTLLNSIDNIHLVSVVSSILLFMVPSLLLGTVSPYAARLKMHSVNSSGRTVGNLYSISTIGSIVGVFLAGFYLIPTFRITTILILFSIILITISLFLNLFYRLSIKPKQYEKA